MADQPIAKTEDSFTTVPQTIEGWCILHQMFRIKWRELKLLDDDERKALAENAAEAVATMEQRADGPSAAFSLIGHKGDLMLIHFRKTFEDLSAAELAISKLRLGDFIEAASSYLSIIELGLYEFSVRLYAEIARTGIKSGSPEWKALVEAELAKQREKMVERIWPKIPTKRYVCFYPMDKRRGENKNWYQLPIDDRRRLMHEHGLIGRRFADRVTQIISGSTGLDDWEWGVDLFADDPAVFKKLIYEMRFDEASAVYALFGSFYNGVRCSPNRLIEMIGGKTGA
jgi:chlorite dismutase